jgi:hypothetical protein
MATRILRLLIYGLIGFVFLGFFVGNGTLLFDLIFTLLLGWSKYLAQVVPEIRFNVESALCFVVALVLATIGLHRIFRGWQTARGHAETWRAGWTLRITGMLLLLFATSIAATGIVHQVGWLFRADQVVYNASMGRISIELNNVKQVMTALKMHAMDNEEMYPGGFDELVPKHAASKRVFFVRADGNEPPERLIYVAGRKATDPAETILIFSPHSFENRRAIGQNDGVARLIDEAEFQARMHRQFAGAIPPGIARAIQSR